MTNKNEYLCELLNHMRKIKNLLETNELPNYKTLRNTYSKKNKNKTFFKKLENIADNFSFTIPRNHIILQENKNLEKLIDELGTNLLITYTLRDGEYIKHLKDCLKNISEIETNLYTIQKECRYE
ncbi:MAG: hypothetical protein KAI53_03655 [Candidatus Aenigmarchaeota archaeon]|nr:hypothetical protein [Candidatus Aenigmarchaeota archaeon]